MAKKKTAHQKAIEKKIANLQELLRKSRRTVPRGTVARFYHFHQNNSGGSFVYTDLLGENVVVEATSAAEANRRLEGLGGYFDGCETGEDCPCCGARWNRLDEDDGYRSYATEAEAVEAATNGYGRPDQAVVHRLDGTVVWHNRKARFGR